VKKFHSIIFEGQYRLYLPEYLPLPHPSWRNTAWLRKNPWFEAELLPVLREKVRALVA
jgi:uracil-DNA glycosylase